MVTPAIALHCVVLSLLFVTNVSEETDGCSAVASVAAFRQTEATIAWNVSCSAPAEVKYYELFWKAKGPCLYTEYLRVRIYTTSYVLKELHEFTEYGAYVDVVARDSGTRRSNTLTFITSQGKENYQFIF